MLNLSVLYLSTINNILLGFVQSPKDTTVSKIC